MAAARADDEYEVIADETVQELGIAFDGGPPGYVAIESVAKGGWGESQDIRVGDILFEMNDQDLERIDAARFKQELTERPLQLVLGPPSDGAQIIQAPGTPR